MAKKRFSASAWSMKWLRDHGYTVTKVEQDASFPDKKAKPCPVCQTRKTIPFKRDAWNLADLIAVKVGEMGTAYIQTTTVAHQKDRIAKILAIDVVPILLNTGNRVWVHGWSKKKNKAKGIDTWQLTIHEITLWPNGQITAQKVQGDESEDTNLFSGTDAGDVLVGAREGDAEFDGADDDSESGDADY